MSKELFFSDIKQLLDGGIPFKMILSKPCLEEAPSSEEGQPDQKQVEKHTQHFTKIIIPWRSDPYLKETIIDFHHCEMMTAGGNAASFQNSRVRETIFKTGTIITRRRSRPPWKSCNYPRRRSLPSKLGIASSQGKGFRTIDPQFRQINKYAEIIDGLVGIANIYPSPIWAVAAYLTFVL